MKEQMPSVEPQIKIVGSETPCFGIQYQNSHSYQNNTIAPPF